MGIADDVAKSVADERRGVWISSGSQSPEHCRRLRSDDSLIRSHCYSPLPRGVPFAEHVRKSFLMRVEHRPRLGALLNDVRVKDGIFFYL